jgi:hypothetical protein
MSLPPLPEAIYSHPTTAFNAIQLRVRDYRYTYYSPIIVLLTMTLEGRVTTAQKKRYM